MRALRHWVSVFFGFSRTETNGFLILLPLTTVVLFSAPLYEAFYPAPLPVADQHRLDSLLKTLVWETPDTTPPPMITFDPNQVSDSMLVRMGVSPRMAERWINFRNKGGQFRTWQDVNKLYGIDSSWVNRAIPFMRFPVPKSHQFARKKKEESPVDINLADTIQLDAVYGIGPALARRITNYRSRLGGFVRMEQLYEVYGLDSVVVKTLMKRFFVSSDFSPVKISWQQATAEELSKHPYIRRKEAQAIAAWCMQHQGKRTLADLAQIHGISAEWIQRIQPYLRDDP
ncbi:MAG TPA: helix-hairpin-helix domain-containing protein [Cyclobacteriaceae bacterium]|nr:helix-hairpin-helix domain-containing protein [Cyclobacteriaceae bacterium]